MLLDDTQRCRKCGDQKAFAAFSRHARARDGLQSDCKSCNASDHSRWYANRGLQVRKQYNAVYYVQHAEERKAQAVKYRAANVERLRAYRVAHAEQLLNYARVWALANPDKILATHRRRRSQKAGSRVNDLTSGQWSQIKCIYGNCCVYCGKKPARLTQDHLVPLARGGHHTASNIVPACRSCNSSKKAGPPLISVQPVLFV